MKVIIDSFYNKIRHIKLQDDITITVNIINNCLIYHIPNMVIYCYNEQVIVYTAQQYYMSNMLKNEGFNNIKINKYRIDYDNFHFERYFPWFVYKDFIIEIYHSKIIITQYNKVIIQRTCYTSKTGLIQEIVGKSVLPAK